jgi:ribosomal-protein-alanine N-acetyltransferase
MLPCQPLCAEDAPALAALHERAMPAGDAWSAQSFAELLTSGAYGWWAGEQQGFLLARTSVDEIELLAIVVNPAVRRVGLGRALLAQLCAHAYSLAARKIFLEVAEDNHPALALYTQQGFLPIGRRERYYAGGQAASVLALNVTTSNS